MAQRVVSGMEEARGEMARYARAQASFKTVGADMDRAWAAGIERLRGMTELHVGR